LAHNNSKEHSMAYRMKTAAVAVAAAFAAGALGYAGGQYAPVAPAQAAAQAAAPAAAAAARTLPDFSELVESQGPAVVNISVTKRIAAASRELPIQPGDPMYEFFRRFQIPMPDGGRERQGVGSGFIVEADGTILTNAHVVADAAEVMVKLSDKREFKAKVLGADRRTDVAVLRIEATGLPTVRTGDPSRVKVGEWVAAIGSPFGLENTVTAGIVSAKHRALPDEGYVPFIQTDVAINPGNSGGPLFNMAGEVVGINSQIYSRTGGYMGLSFSIPIDVALKVKDDLVKYGKVNRGRIGVTIQGVNKDLAESFALDKARGALVNSVEPGGPAAKAGLETGDVILAVDGKPVESSADLPRIIGESKPGTSLGLQVWRKGATRDLRVSVGETPGETLAAAAPEGAAKPAKLGVSVRPLTAEERKARGVDAGVVVENVDGPAAKAGIRAGDVILAFNGEKVDDVAKLRALVDKSKGSVAVLVKRDDATIYVPVRLA
jgi:serine protease Do